MVGKGDWWRMNSDMTGKIKTVTAHRKQMKSVCQELMVYSLVKYNQLGLWENDWQLQVMSFLSWYKYTSIFNLKRKYFPKSERIHYPKSN